MPTLSGMRNRGYPPAAICAFCDAIGVSRADSVIDMSLLEECVRSALNQTAKRAFCVLDPITVVIESLPKDHHQIIEVAGREVILSQEIYIDRNDFMQEPPKGYYRLSVGAEVRLRHAYVIKCHAVEYNDEGQIIRLRCTHDADTLGTNPEGRKVKGVIHWVSKPLAHPVKIYQYDRLFIDENPSREENYFQFINQNSLKVHQGWAEHALTIVSADDIFQFERVGYYKVNQRNSDGKVVAFHRVVDLKNTWSKAS
jgi:glutaminyl-tRNA synthetase